MIKRLRCKIRSIWAKISRGEKWDGHCWDHNEEDDWIFCVDCGTREYIED